MESKPSPDAITSGGSAHSVNVDGLPIAMTLHEPTSAPGTLPLLVAVHGGTYSSAYFGVPGGPLGSFIDIATRNGFSVLNIDRPGYGDSGSLPEETNDFPRQAEVLDAAIGQWLDQHPSDAVVLVGHSIGGMICMEIAARNPAWPLVGVTATGMGARIPPGGAAEELASLPMSGVVDLPVPARDGVMFGPAGTYTQAAQEAAHLSYAPTPFVELQVAPKWAAERLPTVARQVKVPIHNVLAEFDALWDSSPEALRDFESRFSGLAVSTLAPRVGHSIDHHILGAATQLQQLAFAYSCGANVTITT